MIFPPDQAYLVCRRGPLEALMMFTTTISVSSMYNTSSVVMVPIIWLYIAVVVVRISFSIIVLCIYFFVVGYCWY